ncbi:MAG TPA: Fe-S cluster assembly protein SufD [Lysobacter sp.]
MSALLDSFATAFDSLAARDAAGLGESRKAALDAVLRDGIPHARVEAWKYTPLRSLERRSFAASEAAVPAFGAALLDGIPAPRVVFVNGRLDAVHSDIAGLGDGISLQPLSQVLREGEPREANFLARRYDRADEIFARLNSALADDGVVLRAEAGARAALPLHLVFIGAASEGDRAWHLRHLIELREGASLTVVEHHVGVSAHSHLANAVTHVHLGAAATLNHARVQDEGGTATLISRTDAVLAKASEYRRLDLELGAGLSRHELNVALHGDGARLHANGVLLATGKRHLDTRLGIDHVGRDGSCDLTWRGLGAGRSKAAFHGGILIREGADGTAANLSNKNLLLSEGAEIDTQPVLEIHADEVQAAHGATVGQLDPTALFYLRTRGVPVDQARSLLTAAFCRETLAVFHEAGLRETLTARLDAALAKLETA